MGEGLRLALTTFTVVPLRPARADRAVAALAMAAAPLVGLVLGALTALAVVSLAGGGAVLVAGPVGVALLALLTRGMHLDGLADTVDAVGSYAGRERALEIMRSGDVGPFGVAAIVLGVLIQAAALSTVAGDDSSWWRRGGAIVVAVTAGRIAVCWGARRGMPAARPDGLGAVVSGTLPVAVPIGWTLLTVLGAVAIASWAGAVSVLAGTGAALAVQWQCRRRLGGVTGDVFGASIEVASTVTLIVLAAAVSVLPV